MADFTPNFQSLKPSSFPLMDHIDPNQNPNLNFLDNIPIWFSDSFFNNQTAVPSPRFLENWGENFQGIFSQANQIITPISSPVFEPKNPFGNDLHGSIKKRKLENNDAYESSSGNSTPQVSENGINTKNVNKKKKKTFILFGFLFQITYGNVLTFMYFHVCRTMEKGSDRKKATHTTATNRGKWFMLELEEVKQQTVIV